MRRLFFGCIGLLLIAAAACAWAQERTPKTDFDASAVRSPVLGDLRGKTCDAARAELHKLGAGLESCPVGKASGRYPAATINWQSLDPATPASRLAGLRVTLEPAARTGSDSGSGTDSRTGTGIGTAAAIAAAAALAAAIADAARVLPDLRGKTCEQAQAELRKLRIALAECAPGSAGSRYAAGTINEQSHAPGTPASKVDGLRVRLEPVVPPEPVATLPDVRGMTCEQAQSALRRLRIRLAECVPGPAGSGYPAGTIGAQSVAPGTPLARVDGLRVRVEPAPPQARVLPDLRGRTCDEAAEALAALDARFASCTPGRAVDGVVAGRINFQSVKPGAALPLAVPLVLNVQPAPQVIVPALIALPEARATSLLASSKLRARTGGPAAAKGRRVLSQDPAAGTPVAPGSAVAIGLGLSVPDLQGLDCAAARERAAEYGHIRFECEPRPATSSDVAIGRIFEQTPEAGGAVLAEPATIRVAAWAVQQVAVPDVRELALQEAIAAVEAARLVPQPDARRGERIVSAQTPAPGTLADAGSTVRLDTREMVEVPDVVGQPLGAAQTRLQQSRLRDAPDAKDHAGDRIVQSQLPAAHARVAVASVVQLSTRRFATVPDLARATCDEARAKVAPDTFGLQCNDEDSWRVAVFGTPKVATQRPAARSRAEVGSMIFAEARAPLPAAAPWLGNVPFGAVAAVIVAPLVGIGLWLVWRRPPVPPTPPAPSSVAPRVVLPIVPPIVPPPRAPAFEWRVVADASPAVHLRWPAATPARRPRSAASGIAWRVVPDAGQVLLREAEASTGGEDARR
ncbi:MAG TPA: PASTA domain-containing protein [Burkholderiaceae bacterium]|nr:PASTA domain-containing protein [Burkholderiaceae bacterium]